MPDEVLCTIDGGVATVTLNRPGQRNAMNAALLASLSDHFEALDANREVRVVVIRGAGPAFCSGMDLKEMEARGGAQSADPENGVIEVLARVERSRHPTIAMVHGDAIAGGCELALHCDLLVTGQPIDARRAQEIGMVHQVVPAAELEAATAQLSQGIARNAPLALAGIKATIQRAISLRDTVAHADLDEATARARQSADASEGRRAMLEKRRPVFRGD